MQESVLNGKRLLAVDDEPDILEVLADELEKFGVKAIDSTGQPFDPNIHEALAMEETDAMEPNMVLREYQKGYLYKDRLLRPAKVIVSKPPASGA